jgi:hypothetical protein
MLFAQVSNDAHVCPTGMRAADGQTQNIGTVRILDSLQITNKLFRVIFEEWPSRQGRWALACAVALSE